MATLTRADGVWRPFAVIARLATPVSLNHPWLHLDGLIAHLIYLRAAGRDYYALPTKTVRHLAQERMGPFVHTLARRGPLNSASISFFGPDARLGSLQYFKRFEERGAPNRGQVLLAGGHYRSWMLRTVYVSAETVTFYGCGDLALVRNLLGDLTHLGNDGRIGWGRVRDLAVNQTPEDWSLVKEGRAQRPIPVRLLADWEDAVRLAWRPPYWAPEHVELCAPPGVGVTLGPTLR